MEENPGPEALLSELFPLSAERAFHLVHYSHRYAYVYVETPKVSCSTIKTALQLLEVDWDESRLPADIHDRAASTLPKLWRETETLRSMFAGSDYFRFAFVRNPFTRILSAFLDKLVQNEWERDRLAPQLGLAASGPISFRAFLESVREQSDAERDIHWLSQTVLLQWRSVSYDFVGRFEAFDAGFSRVLERLSPGASAAAANIAVRHHQTHAGRRVAEFVGPDERDLIVDIYAEDFENFCYSRDPYFADL